MSLKLLLLTDFNHPPIIKKGIILSLKRIGNVCLRIKSVCLLDIAVFLKEKISMEINF